VSASRLKDVQDCFLVHLGQPRNGANADTLTEHVNNLGGLGGFDPDAFKRLILAECLSTLDAAKALHQAVFVLKTTEFLCFSIAAVTCQLDPFRPWSYIDGVSSRYRQRLRPLVARCRC
jgi:hypothetical protein